MLKQQPIKYCFFMTGNEPWLKLARDLHLEGVATPVLWLGDDVHYAGARELFGESAVRMLDFVHKPLDIPSVNYCGEYREFFNSKDYLDAKDICLKMMDRLDLNGTFSRIDREVYFHKLLVWALKFFYDNKPDAMLMIEKPHSHAQYLIYRVGCYLGVPAAHFKDCSLMPVNFLQTSSGEYVQSLYEIDGELKIKIETIITKYVSQISSLAASNESFTPHYMVKQKENDLFLTKLRNFFGKKGYLLIRDFASDLKLIKERSYRATNPYRFLFWARELVKIKRKKNLRLAAEGLGQDFNFDQRYYYFPLHYEPERTTNPDGENYHDQFKALALLRAFLPKDIHIVVKEHPSQFLMAERGSRGRSPLFYDLVRNISGVTILGPIVDSFKLMKNSCGVATITGSVALEAALLGKPSILFGRAWYEGCPNVFAWSDLVSYSELERAGIKTPSDIETFLKELISTSGVPMVNNSGQLAAYGEKWYDEIFILQQYMGMRSLIEEFFGSINQ